MNLSPEWIPLLEGVGHSAIHWSSVGNITASDIEIMDWARSSGHVVFTHDLDYGALLYATRATSPSVVQIRSDDVRPAVIGAMLLAGIERAGQELLDGALVTIDPRKMRITSLPLRKKQA